MIEEIKGISDTVLIAIIITAPVTLTGIVNGYIKIKADRRQEKALRAVAEKAEEAAVAVAHVKTALKQSDIAVTDKLNTIHSLVNSAMTVQLKLVAELSRWKALQTKNPDDIANADLAEKMLDEHNKAQEAVDGKSVINSISR